MTYTINHRRDGLIDLRSRVLRDSYGKLLCTNCGHLSDQLIIVGDDILDEDLTHICAKCLEAAVAAMSEAAGGALCL